MNSNPIIILAKPIPIPIRNTNRMLLSKFLRPNSKVFFRFKSVKTDFSPEDTDDLGIFEELICIIIIVFIHNLVPVKLATGAELEFLGTSSACSTSTRNVSSLAFHYRK